MKIHDYIKGFLISSVLSGLVCTYAIILNRVAIYVFLNAEPAGIHNLFYEFQKYVIGLFANLDYDKGPFAYFSLAFVFFVPLYITFADVLRKREIKYMAIMFMGIHLIFCILLSCILYRKPIFVVYPIDTFTNNQTTIEYVQKIYKFDFGFLIMIISVLFVVLVVMRFVLSKIKDRKKSFSG